MLDATRMSLDLGGFVDRNPYKTRYVASLIADVDAFYSPPKRVLAPVVGRKKTTACDDCGVLIRYVSYRGRPPHYCRDCRAARGLPETENTQKKQVEVL